MLHGFIVGKKGPYGISSYQGRLHPIFLTGSAFAVNKTIGELKLESLHVNLHTIRRGDDIVLNPDNNTSLLTQDIVVLSGEEADIEAAEAFLLTGS